MKYFVFLISSFLFFGCDPESPQNQQVNPKDMEQLLIDSHRAHIKKEDKIIDDYIGKKKWDNVIVSKTGIRYWIYQKGNGKSFTEIKESTQEPIQVTMAYETALLDGKVCFGATVDNPKFFVAGESEVISGLHELVEYLHEGDRVKTVFPARLAYGLTGDLKKVPPNSPLVYDLVILKWN